MRIQKKPTHQQMINTSSTLNMDAIDDKKRGKTGASSIQRIRATHRTALCLVNAELAHSTPWLQRRLPNSATDVHACSCRVSNCFFFFVAAHPAQSHQQRLTQRIFPPAPRRKTCARGRCLFRRRHWAASSQSTNRRLEEGRALIWRRWGRGVRGERGAMSQMNYS